MKLGQILEVYRQENDLSQRQFAARCGVSNGYIAMIERGVNPATGKPIAPTLPALEKLATGMRISLDDLLRLMDDSPIDMQDATVPVDLAPDEARLLSVYRSLSPDGMSKAQAYLDDLAKIYQNEKNHGVPVPGSVK